MDETPVEPKYKGLPRRYEETKPALEQVFAHRNILGIGEEVLKKFEHNAEKDKELALAQCRELVWQEAEIYKDKCVAEALQQEREEENRRTAAMENEHQKHVQSEIRRTEGLMGQKCIEEVFEERMQGERKLRETVEKLTQEFKLEKMAEVEVARIQERGIAEKLAEEAKQKFHQEKQEFGEMLENTKQQEIQDLMKKLESFRVDSVNKARQEEIDRALKELDKYHANTKEDMAKFLSLIDTLEKDKQQLIEDLDLMTKDRDRYVEKYNILRQEFTAFIEQCRPDFSIGQSDFLLSPKQQN